jgi:hypothetical protein
MHCGSCGSRTVEVRPSYVDSKDNQALIGDAFICMACATQLAPKCKYSNFVTWVGMPCDRCSTPTAFDGQIPGLVEGIVCDQCKSAPILNDDLDVSGHRGTWLCEPCFELEHHGHRQRQLQPILDRLAREFGLD